MFRAAMGSISLRSLRLRAWAASSMSARSGGANVGASWEKRDAQQASAA